MKEFRDANMISVSETWLSDKDPDPTISGLSVVRWDICTAATNKPRGVGVCVYGNDRWCTNVTTKEQHCCQNLNFCLLPILSSSRVSPELHQGRVHPANSWYKGRCRDNRQTMQKQEAVCPDSVRLVLGDFNSVVSARSSPTSASTSPVRRATVTPSICAMATSHTGAAPSPEPGESSAQHSVPAAHLQTAPQDQETCDVTGQDMDSGRGPSSKRLFRLHRLGCFLWRQLNFDEAVDAVTSYITFCKTCWFLSRG